MRLINVDKLIDNLDEMILADDGGDYAMGIATAIQEAGRMAVYEEVKAIPVEWIRNYVSIWISELYKNFALNMINVWEKENDKGSE